MTFPIPGAALENHIAVLGKTGSGKTSTSKLLVEKVVADGFRVCILDPVKSDWWGLVSSADGRKPGLPFQILGGPRGAVALPSTTGAAIGKLVGAGRLPLSIIDMSDFEPGGLQRFFCDFAQALMKSARGVTYLVIEEAHEFAPKERAGLGNENLAIHWAKKLAVAGRSKGLRLVFATQRTQALHNALLGSCETLIAHRLTAEADQKPVLRWLQANAGKDAAAEVAADLARLRTGDAWVCSGEAEMFARVSFPKFATYDNTATPTADGGDRDVKTAPVDIGALEKLLGKAAAEAKDNDPKELRARIKKLETDLAKAKAAVPAGPAATAETLKAAEQRAFDHGFRDGRFAAADAIRRVNASAESLMTVKAPDLSDAIEAHLETVSEKCREICEAPITPPAPKPAKNITQNITAPKQAQSHQQLNGELTPAHQRVIDAVAWWRSVGFYEVKRAHAAVVAGYSPRASTFHGYVAKLSTQGLIHVGDGVISLTDAGLKHATHQAGTGADLADRVRALLKPQQIRVFDTIHAAWPDPVSRSEVAEAVGLSPRASTVHGYIAGVAAYGVIETGKGTVRAANWLFPEAAR